MALETGKSLPLIKQISPQNLLSFGAECDPIELRNLNVFVGTNGSGKSNLLHCLDLMRSTTLDMRKVISGGGGVKEWISKLNPEGDAACEVVLNSEDFGLSHKIQFRDRRGAFELVDERLNRTSPKPPTPPNLYRLNSGKPEILAVVGGQKHTTLLSGDEFDVGDSVLSQIRDPINYPEITFLAKSYESLRLYRDWTFGRHSLLRSTQSTDFSPYPLKEDLSNFNLYLNAKNSNRKWKRRFIEALGSLYEGVHGFESTAAFGQIGLLVEEEKSSFPGSRLSDGTLRFIFLLSVLLDDAPPPLIAIEEPELGLHPDLLPGLADLLVDASTRTQVIVTTHSDILVDALSEHPEAIVVCEKHDGQTTMKRLDANELKVWLDKYRLGQLWIEGHIGGKRW